MVSATLNHRGNRLNHWKTSRSLSEVETPLVENKMSELNLQLRKNTANFDAGLSKGIYFISVKDSKGNVYNSEKIIVIK